MGEWWLDCKLGELHNLVSDWNDLGRLKAMLMEAMGCCCKGDGLV